MKKILMIFLIFSLLLTPAFQASGQEVSGTPDTKVFPQWARDFRRFDIIMFGAFPFSLFFVTTITNTVRWGQHANFSFTDEGRRYAPWPLKSAGAIPMERDEQFRTIMIAAGVSVTVAIIDIIIVNVKRKKERRRIESIQTSTYNIDKSPINPEITEESENITDAGEEEINPENTAGRGDQ